MFKRQRGITFIKTLLIIGGVGLLLLGVTFLIFLDHQKTRDYIRVANIKQIQAALETFYGQTGSYPATASRTVASHNWLPEFNDQGIEIKFGDLLTQPLIAPLPADSSACKTPRPCNGDNQATANDFCYTASPAGCSATGEVKCLNFSLDFCLGSTVNNFPAGEHRISKEGMK